MSFIIGLQHKCKAIWYQYVQTPNLSISEINHALKCEHSALGAQSFHLGKCKVLNIDGGDDFQTMWTDSMPQNCPLKTGPKTPFHVTYIWSQKEVNILLNLTSTNHFLIRAYQGERLALLKFKWDFREFSGGPVARTRCFYCQGPGSIPDWGPKIPKAMRYSQKKKARGEILLQK